jgi:hypothetical protein
MSPFLQETSRYFNNSNSYMRIADHESFNFGSGNFTVEFWAKTTSTEDCTSQPIFNQSNSGAGSDSSIFIGMGFNACVYISDGTGWDYNATGSGIVCNDNEWHHIAAVRNGTALTIYVDGKAQATTTIPSGFTLGNSTRFIEIGTQNTEGYYDGWVSNLRVVKGTAVYTSNFTPPTQKLTAISGTSLLTLIKSIDVDDSTNAHRITQFGTFKLSTFYPPIRKENPYVSSINGGSLYFDGSTDYITCPSSSAFNFGTGNFTIDYWIKFDTLTPNATQNFQTIYSRGYTQAGAILLQTDNGTGRMQVYINGTLICTEPSNPAVGVWIHYAIVRNGSAVTIYKNGVSVASGTSSANITNSSAVSIGVASNSSGSGNPEASFPFKGNLNGFRLSNTARYTTTFVPNNSLLTTDANTAMLLNGSNATIYDATGNNNIESVGSTVNTTYKKFIDSSVFAGNSSNYLQSPSNNDFNFSNKDFTVEAWIYPTSNNSGVGTWWPIVALGKGGAGAETSWWFGIYQHTDSTYHLQLWASSNGANWLVGDTNLPGAPNAGMPIDLQFNQWHHVALAREGNVVRLFFNGVMGGSRHFTDTLFTSSRKLQIGWTEDASGQFNAYIDEVRITKDIARYTNNFTLPTKPFGNTGTLLSYPTSIKSMYDTNNSSISTGTSYFIKPDKDQEFEVFALKQVSDICTIPGGVPSWITNARAIEVVSRSTYNNLDTQTVSYRDFLRIAKSKWDLVSSGSSPYIYWFVVDQGVLWGATRTRFNNSYEAWRKSHAGNPLDTGGGYDPTLDPRWDVWHSTYTITDFNKNTNSSSTPYGIVRMVPHSQRVQVVAPNNTYGSDLEYGLHYKRQDNGEHYPWRNVARINSSSGYFAPPGGLNPTQGGTTQAVPATAIHYIGIGI